VEWVETTGTTIDEAVDAALDVLGVDGSDVEYEVLEEPRAGLFGRVRSEARIRARVKPTTPRPKEERRPRRKATETSTGTSAETTESVEPESPAAERPKRGRGKPKSESVTPESSRPVVRTPVTVTAATPLDTADPISPVGVKFLNGLVVAFGLEATVEVFVVADRTAEFRVLGSDLGVLIGPKAQTLLAIQELLRTKLHHELDDQPWRVMLDVGGYRVKRRAALEQFTLKVAGEVVATGERRALEPMTAADRKVVHDTVNSIEGIASESQGEDPDRRVVLLPT
jgi:spoIIIJ-associated protein